MIDPEAVETPEAQSFRRNKFTPRVARVARPTLKCRSMEKRSPVLGVRILCQASKIGEVEGNCL